MKKTEYQLKVISKIKEARLSMGLGQKFLASELGVSCGLIGCIESINTPHKYTLSQIQHICKTLDIPIKDVFFDADYQLSSSDTFLDELINKIIEYEG